MKWFAVLALAFLAVGCAQDKSLVELNRKQAATIDAQNREISRLNDEMERLNRGMQDSQSGSNGGSQQRRVLRPYDK